MPKPVRPPDNTSDPVVISPDGRFVAVTGLDGKIVLQPLDGSAQSAVPKLAAGFAPLRWCPGKGSLLVYHSGDVPVKILRVDVETGAQTLWKEFAPANRTGLVGIPDLRVGADCQSLAYSTFYVPSELWIAEGVR